MAGRGPAPKPAEQRRNQAAKLRGEWVDLPPLKRPVLPPLSKRTPDGEPWPKSTQRAWDAWRADPVTAQWSPADVAQAWDTIELHAQMTARTASEVRLRMDGLGLTPKGKRDLRWRVGGEVVEAKPRKPAEVRKLRAV
jgi:hypothetical protein